MVPVSTAIMTPIPLMILYIIKLIYQYRQKTKAGATLDHVPSLEKLNKATDISTITQTKVLINNAQEWLRLMLRFSVIYL